MNQIPSLLSCLEHPLDRALYVSRNLDCCIHLGALTVQWRGLFASCQPRSVTGIPDSRSKPWALPAVNPKPNNSKTLYTPFWDSVFLPSYKETKIFRRTKEHTTQIRRVSGQGHRRLGTCLAGANQGFVPGTTYGPLSHARRGPWVQSHE